MLVDVVGFGLLFASYSCVVVVERKHNIAKSGLPLMGLWCWLPSEGGVP